MTGTNFKLPFVARASVFFVGLFAVLAILYLAQEIIVPLIFATIVAIVLHPVVNLFVRIRVPRVLAILITLLLALLVLAALGVLLAFQARKFTNSLPVLAERFAAMLNQAVSWVSAHFHINAQKIRDLIARAEGALVNTSSEAIGLLLVSLGKGLVVALLVPVYIFLLLLYHPLLIEFIHRLFRSKNQGQVSEIVTQTKSLVQRYLVGLVLEALIVAVLNTTALLVLGIDYAILLGIVGALLNVIPFVGGIVAAALPMIIALGTKPTGWTALWVMALYFVIQLVDNNYIVPKIVASKVRINALFSILAVLAGNAMWGIPGMFLSIPLLAILKLVFDSIKGMQPWGFLIGDTMPPLIRIDPILKAIIERTPLRRLKRRALSGNSKVQPEESWPMPG